MLLLIAHLTEIITTLRAAIAACAHPLVQREPARAPFFLILHNRVGRAARLIARLYTLWQAGRLPKPRPSQAGATRTRTPPVVTFPRARAWLVRIGGYRIAASGSHLQYFLQRPDLPEFLAAAPQALRHLRPLCQMLGADLPPGLLPAGLQPPKPPARPRIKPPKPPAAPPTGTPDRPIPRNILAAARAWRRRYG